MIPLRSPEYGDSSVYGDVGGKVRGGDRQESGHRRLWTVIEPDTTMSLSSSLVPLHLFPLR